MKHVMLSDGGTSEDLIDGFLQSLLLLSWHQYSFCWAGGDKNTPDDFPEAGNGGPEISKITHESMVQLQYRTEL